MRLILSRMKSPATRYNCGGAANSDERAAHTISPSTTATSVVIIKSVRRLKRLCHSTHGNAASVPINSTSIQYGTGISYHLPGLHHAFIATTPFQLVMSILRERKYKCLEIS